MATRAPSPAVLGALLLHAGVAAMFFVRWPQTDAIVPMVNSVPVSIVSSEVVEAAPADNPSEEVVTEDAATAPVESPTPPEPTPPAPAPAPTPPPPRPTPTPRPTPPRETRPAPTPPRPAPPRPDTRPTPPRTETRSAPSRSDAPALDLDALAGPRRPAPTPGPRAPTGQQGRGQAAQATGPQIAAIFRQVDPAWPASVCERDDMRVVLDVTLSADGRIVSGPTLVSPQSDPTYRVAADGVLRAFREVGVFDVPANFPGGRFRPSYITQTVCRNR